jgi:hypothetical protein
MELDRELGKMSHVVTCGLERAFRVAQRITRLNKGRDWVGLPPSGVAGSPDPVVGLVGRRGRAGGPAMA